MKNGKRIAAFGNEFCGSDVEDSRSAFVHRQLCTDGFNGDYSTHPFGRERSTEDIIRRLAWETEAEGLALRAGSHVLANAHSITRRMYARLLLKST